MTTITIKEVILRHDVPLVVWATDDKKSNYLGVNYDDGATAHLYYFARVKHTSLQLLFNERIDARYILTKLRLGKFQLAEMWGDIGNTAKVKSTDSVDDAYLPEPGMFLPFSATTSSAAIALKKVDIDGRWGINDLSKFSDLVQDAYSFGYALSERGSISTRNHIEQLFTKYPWRGGFSSVNFFNALYSKIPAAERADVREIQYASPGQITLKLDGAVAESIREIVYKIISDDGDINKVYKDTHRWLQDRNLLRSSTRDRLLTLHEQQHLESQLENLCTSFGLSTHKVKILALGRSDILAATKILLAYYRRLQSLADYVATGKAQDIFSTP